MRAPALEYKLSASETRLPLRLFSIRRISQPCGLRSVPVKISDTEILIANVACYANGESETDFLNPIMLPTKPTCCLLTHSGRGAVAVVGLVGEIDAVVAMNDQLFEPVGSHSFKALIDQTHQAIFYGRWKSTAEDLVVVKTEQGLEIHCHGGDAASAAIIDDLKHAGCELKSKQQWRLHNGNQWRAETEAAICTASTIRTANLLLQISQNQSAVLSKISTQIKARNLPPAIATIKHALFWADFGLSLTQPRSLVFCGHPNVGKSSLVNAIAGFQRAIVNSQAGTTRDVLSQSTAIDGWPVDLKDTAGLRTSQDRIEALGIVKAKEEIAKSQIRCLVLSCEDFQGSKEIENQAIAEHQRLLQTIDPHLVVFNKSDLAPNFKLPTKLDFTGPTVVVSASQKEGLNLLVDSIAKLLVPNLPQQEQWFPVSPWQRDRLQSMLQQLSDDDFEAAQSSLRPY